MHVQNLLPSRAFLLSPPFIPPLLSMPEFYPVLLGMKRAPLFHTTFDGFLNYIFFLFHPDSQRVKYPIDSTFPKCQGPDTRIPSQGSPQAQAKQTHTYSYPCLSLP